MARIVETTDPQHKKQRGKRCSNAMFWMDLWENTVERMELPRQPDCPCCRQHQYEFLTSLSSTSSTSLCGRNAVQVRGNTGHASSKLDFLALAERLRTVSEVHYNEFLRRFLVDGYDITVFPDARAIIKGTDDPQVARSVYARYIGM